MRTICCLIVVLIAGSLIAVADDQPACSADDASLTKGFASYDFYNWPIAGWQDVREERFPKLGHWMRTMGGMTNHIPADADEKAVVSMKDGVGMASSVITGPPVHSLTAHVRMAFNGKGAPSLLIRAQVDGQLTKEMLSLVLYEKGINLWRFDGEKWHKAAFARFDVEPDVYHKVRVQVDGSSAKVWVNGRRTLATDDTGLNAPGAVGLWAGEGPCFFKSLRMKYGYVESTNPAEVGGGFLRESPWPRWQH